MSKQISSVPRHLPLFLLIVLPIGTLNAQNWGEIRTNAKDSLVFIQSERSNRDGTNEEISTATGFIVSTAGYVLTAGHAIYDQEEDKLTSIYASIRSRDNTKLRAKLITKDHEADLALLQLPDIQRWKAISIDEAASVQEDEAMYVLGFPLEQDLSSAYGRLSNRYGNRGRWQTTIALNRGNSGSPVFNADGNVVAIVNGGLDEAHQITFVTPIRFANNLLSILPGGQSGSSIVNPVVDSESVGVISMLQSDPDTLPKYLREFLDVDPQKRHLTTPCKVVGGVPRTKGSCYEDDCVWESPSLSTYISDGQYGASMLGSTAIIFQLCDSYVVSVYLWKPGKPITADVLNDSYVYPGYHFVEIQNELWKYELRR